MTIKGTMATDMFSKKFTDLDSQEKDTIQKTYYNIDPVSYTHLTLPTSDLV